MSALEDKLVDQGEATVDDPDALGAPSKRVRPIVDERNLGSSIGKGGQTLEEALSDRYKMDYAKRGKAIIINNKNFSFAMEAKGYKTRQGTDEDACGMLERLQYLGFDVDMHKNKTCAQMMDILVQAAQFDHSDADCFICVLLSHGEEGVIFGVDGPLEIKNIFNLFKGQNCRTLAGKPKLFFIQACRGSNLDEGVYVMLQTETKDRWRRRNSESQVRPISWSLIQLYQGTIRGEIARRVHGSCRLYSLCC